MGAPITHYLRVGLPRSVARPAEELGRIVTLAHRVAPSKFAVDLPGWKPRDREAPLGREVVFFGEECSLADIAAALPDALSIKGPRPVPLVPLGYVVLQGHRPPKSAAKAQERLMAHLLAKGKEITTPLTLGSPDYQPANPDLARAPFLELHSASTGNKFIRKLTRTRVKAAKQGEFSSFGLSMGTATVPEL